VQTNLQNILGIAEWRLDPQSAIDAPKWVWSGGRLALEARFPDSTFERLQSDGLDVERLDAWAPGLSRAQVVGRSRDGSLVAASDLRGEGSLLAL
jgi:gamma-glutamyltranspeptidase/glutathione hydrolase